MAPPQQTIRGATSEAIEEDLDEARLNHPEARVVVRLGMHQADNENAINAVSTVIGSFADKMADLTFDAFGDPVISWGCRVPQLSADDVRRRVRETWSEHVHVVPVETIFGADDDRVLGTCCHCHKVVDAEAAGVEVHDDGRPSAAELAGF